MKKAKQSDKQKSGFYLDKWFLDVVTDEGEAMIFYAAQLVWKGWTVPYTSWLHYQPGSGQGVQQRSRFRNVQMPLHNEGMIRWSDARFGVEGEWQAAADPLQARLFDSEEGYLDWRCFQPVSRVQLHIGDTLVKGRGYAEQLILTAPPWKIPMDELRWGRMSSEKNYLVWVEIKEKRNQQWLWWNGERVGDAVIQDDQIALPKQELLIKLDRSVELEGEKKIFTVVGDLLKFIPGFDQVMPLQFLMADERKWLSRSQLYSREQLRSSGMAIHELVDFKA